jgi:hypothetical protein
MNKLISSISEDLWTSYQEWLENLTKKQAAKFRLHCYHLAYKEKLLPLIPELERDTEESFDIAFWNTTGQDLFLEACEKEHKPANKYCCFCNIRLHVKSVLEKDFEQEQQKEMEEIRQGLLTRC